jgi:hypothetical protein
MLKDYAIRAYAPAFESAAAAALALNGGATTAAPARPGAGPASRQVLTRRFRE